MRFSSPAAAIDCKQQDDSKGDNDDQDVADKLLSPDLGCLLGGSLA